MAALARGRHLSTSAAASPATTRIFDQVEGVRAAVLAPGVHFTQHDVRAVQLAKAAIRTGVELLLREAVGCSEGDIERVIIAGAFGAYHRCRAAGSPSACFRTCRSIASRRSAMPPGVGVRQMLASRKARARARELADRCRYVELSTRAEFQKSFLHNIGFNRPAGS